jgi:hypothetical protein
VTRVGRHAVRGSSWCLALACVAVLPACRSFSGFTGAAAGVAAGSAVADPAVAVAVGIAVQAGLDAAVNTLLRRWSHEEQLRIAALVGAMEVGERRPWEVHHALPYRNEQGEVTLVRAFATPLANCREAVFSVDDLDAQPTGAPRPHFVTTVCQGADGWRWAAAEPAVARWGALQ